MFVKENPEKKTSDKTSKSVMLVSLLFHNTGPKLAQISPLRPHQLCFFMICTTMNSLWKSRWMKVKTNKKYRDSVDEKTGEKMEVSKTLVSCEITDEENEVFVV